MILVTTLRWWLYGGDSFQMSMPESLYWRLFPHIAFNVKNRSSTSQSCHQHKPFPAFVTEIDVAWYFSYRFVIAYLYFHKVHGMSTSSSSDIVLPMIQSHNGKSYTAGVVRKKSTPKIISTRRHFELYGRGDQRIDNQSIIIDNQ